MGLRPVPLGLDLRGGVHFLFEVDVSTAVKQRLDSYAVDFNKLLRENRIRRSISVTGNELLIRLPDAADADRARAVALTVNSKVQRVEVCTALETLLIDLAGANAVAAELADSLRATRALSAIRGQES